MKLKAQKIGKVCKIDARRSCTAPFLERAGSAAKSPILRPVSIGEHMREVLTERYMHTTEK